MRHLGRLFVIVIAVSLLATLLPRLSPAEEEGTAPPAVAAKKKTAKKSGKVKSGKKKPAAKTAPVKGNAKTAPVKDVAVTAKEEAVQAPEPAAGESEAPAIVTEMRHWSTPDYTRIAVTVDREVKFEAHEIPKLPNSSAPPRLYVDITPARVAAGVKDIPIGDGLMKTARIGQYRPDTVRVVLDLGSIKESKVFTFADPFRIIIDVRGERREEITRPREAELTPLPAPAAKPERPVQKPKAAAGVGKVRRIVVDAGHGGHDPGASGVGGTKEKDVVLQIALKLAQKLREELGLDVVLTRSTDVFLELQERTAIANKVGADLFVSIHANASLNRSSAGTETYYLNLAKTEKAAQLAAKENGTSLEKVSLLQAVLFDLMANYKLNDSAHLADEVQKSVYRRVSSRYAGVRNLGVKQGPFYVLVGATMPSILVETAFVSNDREEERLKDSQYQDATAEGIMEGIRAYMASLK